MTPVEKEAKELIEKFRNVNFKVGESSKMIASYEDCKQCALICVDKICEKIMEIESEHNIGIVDNETRYYEEVKQAILNYK